jgi:uncharacterized membrane protein YraQ (UPF0718 family)
MANLVSMGIIKHIADALYMAAAMGWDVAWSLVLGFVLSGIVQVVVPRRALSAQLGGNGPRPIALATLYGIASSSCSYASTAVTKSLIARGAGFIPSLAFLLASTNLVIELGVILWQLMGWQFMLAEWIGGVVLVAMMSAIVAVTHPRAIETEAREVAQRHTTAETEDNDPRTWLERLRAPETRIAVAQSVAMDWSMLRGDLMIGFLIAGVLATWVPNVAWQHLFFQQTGNGALASMIAPFVAIISFVCSIGNVPLAAALWTGGVGFGGVLAFLYSDVLVLPLLDVYRKYFGIKPAAYIAIVFYAAIVLSAWIVNAIFAALHIIPQFPTHALMENAFQLNFTCLLNILALGVVVAIVIIIRKNPAASSCCSGEEPEPETSCCGH